jgi:hypothetical protein
MAGKIFAGIVMGIVVAILASLVVGLGTGGGERGGHAGLWGALIGFVLTMVLALRAGAGRYAWGRGFLLAGLLCLAMPLASMMLAGIVGAEQVSHAASNAEKAGSAAGVFLGGTIITFVSGVVGFFLGAIFLISSYFALRRPAITA